MIPLRLVLSRNYLIRQLPFVLALSLVAGWFAGLWTGVAVFCLWLATELLGVGRIELDDQAVTLIPLLPYRRRQRIEFHSLGSFTQGSALQPTGKGPIPLVFYPATRVNLVRAPLVSGRRRWLISSLIPSKNLTLTAIYARRFSDPPIPLNELADLLNEYRGQAVDDPATAPR